MTLSDKTGMGGVNELFMTTHWTEILAAGREEDADRRNAVLNALLKRYWKPVYCYLRQKGCGNERAKDLTQGFFVEIVMGREMIRKVDPTKGRFRGFLLKALEWYAIDEHRKELHEPACEGVCLDWAGPGSDCEPVAEETPETTFDRLWAEQLLGEVIEATKEDSRKRDQERHWRVFEEWDLRPILEAMPRPDIEDLCQRLEIEDRKTAHNMSVTVKRRFRRILEGRLRQEVGSETDIEQEISDLIRIFSHGRADA